MEALSSPEEDSSSDDGLSAMVVSDLNYRKYKALKRRCQLVQQENRRLVNRVYQVQRLVRRCRRECHLVAARLDQHGDNYREVALRTLPEAPAERTEDGHEPMPKVRPKPEKKPKRKLNEPKKPSNPFFQYCQEQRGLLLSQMKGQTASSLSKQGLTKQLAANWSVMSSDDKQKYVDRYERDKRQYALAVQRLQGRTRPPKTEPP